MYMHSDASAADPRNSAVKERDNQGNKLECFFVFFSVFFKHLKWQKATAE